MQRYASVVLSFLAGLVSKCFLVSKPVYAQSAPVYSLHVLAGISALSILEVGSALADSIPGTIHDKDSPVIVPSSTFPTPQITNGTLIIGTGQDAAATLKILPGGEVTVGGAVIGNSPKANGMVNVTGLTPSFLAPPETLLSAAKGQATSPSPMPG